MFVKVDGAILYFCSTKCEKNTNKLKRKARETLWTAESRKWRGSEKLASENKKDSVKKGDSE
jgi:large subunit ribosomal protein L24e